MEERGVGEEFLMILFVFTVFLSAFLLLQVQPIVARFILPWYGGSPAVWTTCMLFFQVGLLLGYGYAHLLASAFRRRPGVQLGFHLAFIALACISLPITPAVEMRPSGGEDTSNLWGIVRLLALTVGLPYVVVSASGPLLQHWFAGIHRGRSPYWLYAVSNLGSLLGLLSYPFLVEPLLGLERQTWWWSAGFALFGVLAILCAWRHRHAVPPGPEQPEDLPAHPAAGVPLLWILLAASGSAVMLAITNQMCQDVAVIPFFWVLPLGLYLTSFIIAFERSLWYRRWLWIPLAALGTGAMVYLLNRQFAEVEMRIDRQIVIYLFALFALCMVCHGELVRIKPHPRYLTAFYLLVSLGGAVGGLFVSLVAPQIFTGYWELHAILLVISLTAGLLIAGQLLSRGRAPASAALAICLAATGTLAYWLWRHVDETRSGVVTSRRSFHGVIRVYETYAGTPDHFLSMFHGRITHGRQYQNPIWRAIPTSYYGERSGVGAIFESVPQRKGAPGAPLRIGVVGLGSGSLAVHVRERDTIVFYEINPQVAELADSHFSYLAECRADTSVVLGDARTSLEEELASDGPRRFDLLFVDAFSGDSIPIHLLTREAFALYFRHLVEGGSLVVHITNLHIDLSDPVRQLARQFGREALLVQHDPEFEEDANHLYFSEWVIVTKNPEVIRTLNRDGWVTPWRREEPKEIHWTDDYSNLFRVMMLD